MSDDVKPPKGLPGEPGNLNGVARGTHGWPKGVSGNPGGRPKGIERTAREAMQLREYKAHDGKTYKGIEAAIHCLLDMGFSEKTPPRERIAALKEAIDRGWGRAKQSIEMSGSVDTSGDVDVSGMTLDERRQFVAFAMKVGALGPSDDTEH